MKKKKGPRMISVAEYATECGVSPQMILKRVKNTLEDLPTKTKLPEGVSAQRINRTYVIIIN